jgi:hypothetical protein
MWATYGLATHIQKLNLLLGSREVEILTMVAEASGDCSTNADLVEFLTSWSTYVTGRHEPDLTWSDNGSMELLLKLGIVPTNTASKTRTPMERLGVAAASDRLHVIAKGMRRQE